ncbi:MAG: hypothetical protein OXH02_01810 [Gemmatimonadetes bacterium]|nr:hypothetical protein [Gemmatimonadota bacterium]
MNSLAFRFLAVAAVIILLPGELTGLNRDAFAEVRHYTKTVAFEPGGHLDIETGRGSLELLSWDRNEVEIVARIESPFEINPDYAREIVTALKIEVEGSGRSLRIRSDYDDIPSYKRWFISIRHVPYVHYEIRMPRRIHLDLEVRHTDTRIRNVEGAIRINAHYSEVTGTDWTGLTRLDMDHGTLRLTELDGAVELDARHADVHMEATHLSGDTRIRAHRGQTVLYLPRNQALDLYSDVSHQSDLDSDFEISTPVSRRDEGIIAGTINGGGSLLDLRGDHTRFRLRSSDP